MYYEDPGVVEGGLLRCIGPVWGRLLRSFGRIGLYFWRARGTVLGGLGIVLACSWEVCGEMWAIFYIEYKLSLVRK